MDERDIDMVAAAFDRLLAQVAQFSDAQTCWTINAAKDDVINILAGTWRGDEDSRDEADDDDAPAALQLDDEYLPF